MLTLYTLVTLFGKVFPNFGAAYRKQLSHDFLDGELTHPRTLLALYNLCTAPKLSRNLFALERM